MLAGHVTTASFRAPMVNSSRALHVLVVDDEPLIRWSLAETLTACGHVVTEAGDAAATRRAVTDDTQRPDVVLLDYRLPDSNDLGLLAAIRREAPRTQVILMTAHGTSDITRGALELGAYRVVSKPFALQDLAALVSEAHAAADPAPTSSR
jgi:DNA-binding NtrC family response regulator